MSILSKAAALFAWTLLVALGFGYAWRYEATQGASAGKKDWPSASRLELDSAGSTIVLFAHPNCPCTLVAIDQLAKLLNQKRDRPRVYVDIVQAPGLPEKLSDSSVAQASRKIPGAVVMADPGGTEAKRFGAKTSGQTFAFGPNGEERFRGGLTSARGHYGPNAGIDALEAILNGRSPVTNSAAVYGCSLLGAGQ